MYYDHNNHNNRKELLKRIFYLSGITVGVYLLFAYVLVLVIPFLFAFAFVRAMWPFAERIGINTGMSKKCAGYILAGTVTLLLTVVFAGIGYGLYIQLRKLVCNFSYIQLVLENNINHMCCVFEESFNIRNGTIRNMLISSSDGVMNICVDKILPYVTKNGAAVLKFITSAGISILFFVIASWILFGDYEMIRNDFTGSFIYKNVKGLIINIKDTVWAFVKTQLIIIAIIAIVCSIGLMLVRNPYALLLGVFIAFFDALPVVGSGSVFVPWSIACIVRGDVGKGTVLLVLYLVCLILREVLEPKIMGQQSGLRPIYTLISFYIGIKLFGISGIILGPVFVTAIYYIYKTSISPNEQEP